MPEPDTTAAAPRLLAFVRGMTALVSREHDEPALLDGADALLRTLVATDDWLPEAFARPHPEFYQQYLLYGDPFERFSVVSFVWGPGQSTPIHDHTVWGVVGMLRGSEYSVPFRVHPSDAPCCDGDEERLEPGDTIRVSPAIGDVHRVRNAYDDRVSISVHVYGGNIGRIRRHVFDPTSGTAREFVSGYAGSTACNLWAPATA